jgi:hypothetical protein
MKNLMLIICVVLAILSQAGAQVQIDIEVGVSPATDPQNAPVIINRDNPFEEFRFNMVHTKPQFFAGVKAHIALGTPFFLKGGLTYTRSNSLYQVAYTIITERNPIQNMFMSESEDLLLFPVDIGVSLGSVDITSGLTLRKAISSLKELNHIDGFTQDEPSVKMGWQMGARYAFKRTMIGVEYQGSLNRIGQDMFVNGHSLEINHVPGRFVFTVGYRI